MKAAIRIAEIKDFEEAVEVIRNEQVETTQRLVIKGKQQKYDDILEENIEVDMYFNFWDTQAYEAHRNLNVGDYVYIPDYTEKIAPPSEQYQTSIVFRAVKNWVKITEDKFKQVVKKLNATDLNLDVSKIDVPF